jgi:hypothetical protein
MFVPGRGLAVTLRRAKILLASGELSMWSTFSCGYAGGTSSLGDERNIDFDGLCVTKSKEEGAVTTGSRSPPGEPKYWNACASLPSVPDQVVDWNECDGVSIERSMRSGSNHWRDASPWCSIAECDKCCGHFDTSIDGVSIGRVIV